MSRRTIYSYRDGSGRTGKAYAAGIARLLKQGRRLTVQRVDRVVGRAGAKVVAAACGELYVREQPSGSNSGERVRAYQASTTVAGTGWPWCQAFVRFVWDRAGVHRRGYRGAYVPHLEAWARSAGVWRTSDAKAAAGWACVMDFGRDGLADHVGIVVRVLATGEVETIEGNTSAGASGSQDNGGGVFRRVRSRNVIRGFVAI